MTEGQIQVGRARVRVPALEETQVETAQTRPRGSVGGQVAALIGLYVLLHVVYDILLWSTALRGLPSSVAAFYNPDALLFFLHARLLASGAGFDFIVHTALFLVAWVGAFAIGRRRYDLSFNAAFGVVILAYFFLRAIYAFLPDLQAVFTPGSQPGAIPRDVLYRTVIAKLFREFVLPLFAVLLVFGAVPGLQAAKGAGRKVRGALRRTGAWVKQDPLTDTMHGLWLHFIVFWLAVFATWVASEYASTADESQVFAQMTLDLVFLISFAAGLGEEFIYRAVLFTFLLWLFRARRADGSLSFWPAVAALLVQALLFALAHSGYQNLAHVITPFLFAILVGYIFLRYGFIPAVLVHFLIDVMAFGGTLAAQNAQLAPYIYFGLALLLFGGLFASAIYFLFRFLTALEQDAELLGRLAAS